MSNAGCLRRLSAGISVNTRMDNNLYFKTSWLIMSLSHGHGYGLSTQPLSVAEKGSTQRFLPDFFQGQ